MIDPPIAGVYRYYLPNPFPSAKRQRQRQRQRRNGGGVTGRGSGDGSLSEGLLDGDVEEEQEEEEEGEEEEEEGGFFSTMVLAQITTVINQPTNQSIKKTYQPPFVASLPRTPFFPYPYHSLLLHPPSFPPFSPPLTPLPLPTLYLPLTLTPHPPPTRPLTPPPSLLSPTPPTSPTQVTLTPEGRPITTSTRESPGSNYILSAGTHPLKVTPLVLLFILPPNQPHALSI